ncbi:DUF6221 family protein [Streptomyces sp. NPDC006872]|uniref:DUF6221 family protein n=1 Tax=Streptomyces sp. NPDC006872 TaxID=3155720 RepID=UPI0033D33551
MSDIADFLRARFAERRAVALAASPGPWHANAESDEVVAEDGITVADGFALSGQQLRATVDHIALHDPADVIADLDAKLGIVDHYERTQAYAEVQQRHEYVLAAGACAVALKTLAQPYVGHPDHRGEEWTP